MLHTPLEKQLNLQEEFLILFIIIVVIDDDDDNYSNNNIVFPFYSVATATVLIENSGTEQSGRAVI